MSRASVLNVSSVFFICMLQVCLFGCCTCFAYILQVFYLDVAFARAFSSGFVCFLQVFLTHVSSVSSVFRRMLQMFHLDVSKVDKVLHLSLVFCYLVSVSPPPPDAG
jgi:hypothetical protein